MRKAKEPADRLAEINKVRRKARRGFKEVQRKKNATRPYGEVEHRKRMSVILAVAGYTNSQIASTLGENRKTIGEWKKEGAWNEEYYATIKALTEGAKTLLQSYAIEAVNELVVIMRTTVDDTVRLKAIAEIFDRGGMPKTSRQEKETSENLNLTDDGLIEKLRSAPPEVQEQAATLIEGLEKLLGGNESGNSQTPDSDIP